MTLMLEGAPSMVAVPAFSDVCKPLAECCAYCLVGMVCESAVAKFLRLMMRLQAYLRESRKVALNHCQIYVQVSSCMSSCHTLNKPPGMPCSLSGGQAPLVYRYFSFMFIFFLAHQFALSLFRTIAAVTRSLVLSYPAAWLMFLTILLLGGFILNKSTPSCADHGSCSGYM